VSPLSDAADLEPLLEGIMDEVAPLKQEGEVNDYIPAMDHLDEENLAIALSDVNGNEVAVGDADVEFAIQSVSKVFALALALEKVGPDLWERVNREPSGDPFNSLVQLEHEEGIPRNPMINAGSLVVADVLLETCGDAQVELLDLMQRLAGDDLAIDDQVYTEERRGGDRNRAMAHLMGSFGNLTHEVDEVLDLYVHHCAVRMTTRQLARAARFLANDGVDPTSGDVIVSEPLARRINAIMLTCGTYDAAGEFAFSVGLPCKSGVSGSILAVVPDRMGAAVFSPPLDDSGNSNAGREALHLLSERLDLSIF
jgi:glutaminase